MAAQQTKVRVETSRNYSANVGLIAIVVGVMGGAMLIAAQVGAAPAILIAGFTAIFFTLGIGGGSLRADLRKAAWYGPLTALAASLPRVVADYHLGIALALVASVIFVAGLLPALGRNYQQAGLGLGLATVLGFALQADTGSAGQTVLAAFVGVGFVVLLRIALKFRDPSDVTRELAAGTLTNTDPGFGQAYLMWLRDTPVRWIDEVLQVAVGYRTVRAVVPDGEDATLLDARAEEVAALVAAKQPSAPPVEGIEPAPRPSVTAFGQATRALDRIEELARSRDQGIVQDAAATRRVFARASIRSVLVWRSQILRHALRTMIGVVLTFLLAWATVGPKDPLVTSMATAAFAILQISWGQTLFKAKERLLGVAGGAAVMALALWLLPQEWLLPFALLGAVSGLWLIASNQVWSIGSFVLVSVGMNAATRGLDPSRTLIEYVLLLLAGVTIGLLCGFVVVPHLEPDRVGVRVSEVRRAVVQLLRQTAKLAPSVAGAGDGSVHPAALVEPLHELRTAAQNLAAPLHREDEQAGVHASQCRLLATRFEMLAIVGVVEAAEGRLTAATLEEAAHVLNQPLDLAEVAEAGNFVRLAQWVGAESRQLCGDRHAVQ